MVGCEPDYDKGLDSLRAQIRLELGPDEGAIGMFAKNGLVADGQSLSLEGISGLAFAKWRLGLERHVLDVNYRPVCRAPGSEQLGDPPLCIGIVSRSQARTIEALLYIDEKQGGAG
jgi:hypothetical protein